MAHDLQFQVLVLPSAPWDVLIERYTYIEDLGFDSIGIGDHFVDWNNPSLPWLEAWTVLAAIARETSRIRLATAVAQFPLRNPALLARQALTLDHLSNGRFTLGLGTGLTIDPAYDMMGIPNWGPKERVARFREYVQAVDRMLSNETSSFHGEYYQIDGAVMNPRPIQKPR
ncbi:MAG: LLM class flavin-dependent oxidoreductase, partial [Alphaproteobacteria bacterium]